MGRISEYKKALLGTAKKMLEGVRVPPVKLGGLGVTSATEFEKKMKRETAWTETEDGEKYLFLKIKLDKPFPRISSDSSKNTSHS